MDDACYCPACNVVDEKMVRDPACSHVKVCLRCGARVQDAGRFFESGPAEIPVAN